MTPPPSLFYRLRATTHVLAYYVTTPAPLLMFRQKVTKARLDALPPPASGQRFLRDTELRGFAVRVAASGAKSFVFVLERRIRGRDRRLTLGRYPDLTVEQARQEARKVLGKIAIGIDPRLEAVTEREETALTEYVFPGEGEEGYLVEPRVYIQRVIRDSRVQFTLRDFRRTFITIADSPGSR